jgi:hypothetical protein
METTPSSSSSMETLRLIDISMSPHPRLPAYPCWHWSCRRALGSRPRSPLCMTLRPSHRRPCPLSRTMPEPPVHTNNSPGRCPPTPPPSPTPCPFLVMLHCDICLWYVICLFSTICLCFVMCLCSVICLYFVRCLCSVICLCFVRCLWFAMVCYILMFCYDLLYAYVLLWSAICLWVKLDCLMPMI